MKLQNYTEAMPLCQQMKDTIRKMLIAKAFHTGEQMPQVRELAAKLAINPKTIEQAYKQLEQEGYLYTVQGQGTFVADEASVVSCRRRELMCKFDQLVMELSDLSVSADELTRRVEDLVKGE